MILPESVFWFCEQIFYVVRLIMILGFVLTFFWIFFLRHILLFKKEMKKGLSFKESVKQVFKESLVNGSGDGSYQHNHNAFDHQAHARRLSDAHYNAHKVHIHHPVSTSSWVTDPDYKHLSGNIYNR